MLKLILMIMTATFAFYLTTCHSKLIATNEEIKDVSKRMFEKADMSLSTKVKFNENKKPVFDVTEDDLNNVKTVKTMRALFNNYEWDSGKEQVVTDEHIREQNAFLDAIIETEVIKILMQFFKEKKVGQVIDGTLKSQKEFLGYLWFTNYAYDPKAGIEGSSGFKHVFCKDFLTKKKTTVLDVAGLHNWIFFRDEEIQGSKSSITFTKLTKPLLTILNNVAIISCGFTAKMGNQILSKDVSSIFVATTPELEIALYTLCAVMEKETCEVSLNGKSITIKAHFLKLGTNQIIKSTYPEY